MIPVYCIIIPLLHILLGLGNIVCKNLFDYAYKHINILHTDEINAINNVILAKVEVDELTSKYNLVDTEY